MEFKQFCSQSGIKHVTCPVRDHKGNGKVERIIRTINERLRTNKEILLKREKSGLSEILYALRTSKKAYGKSRFEKHQGREPNTIKRNMVQKLKNVLAEDPQLKFDKADFEDDLDSTIMVRERTRGSKLEGDFQKKKGRITGETSTTISFPPEGKNKEVKLSKRDVAKKPSCSWQMEEESEEEHERPMPPEAEQSELNSSVVEIPPPRKEAVETEKTAPEEMAKESGSSLEGIKTEMEEASPPIKATVQWKKGKSLVKRETRKRRPTIRYGIDLVSRMEQPSTNK